MSFDPRSLERLRQLGRQLPQPLPKEDSRPEGSGRTGRKRHKVETEENPQALFHELMKASADGTVPDHLMARLKQAEQKVDEERRRLGTRANANADRSSPSEPLGGGPFADAADRNLGQSGYVRRVGGAQRSRSCHLLHVIRRKSVSMR